MDYQIVVARWLADAVPTGYRVVLVEKNSHFHFLFAFPRYSVVPGYERGAFIPYDEALRRPKQRGSLLHVQAEAEGVTATHVQLAHVPRKRMKQMNKWEEKKVLQNTAYNRGLLQKKFNDVKFF